MTKKMKQPTAQSKTLLQRLAAMPDKLFSSAFEFQYGAICYQKTHDGSDIEVLLITSRGTGRGIIPKGWPVDQKKPHQATQIEALEEAGVMGRARKKPVGRYTYLK